MTTKIHTAALPYQIGDRVRTKKYSMPEGTIAGYVYWPTYYCLETGKPLRCCYIVVDDNGCEREIFESNIEGVINV